jgi:alkylation response protein AidB-like acyl-CoA dehydrogenase
MTAELRELQAVVRAFLEKESPEATVRATMATEQGWDRALWSAMAESIGLQGLAIPEQYGGSGAGWAEQGVVLEEMGRALVCAPYLATVGLAVPALLAADDHAAAERWLPGIAAGEIVATAVLTGDPPAEADGRLTGVSPHVLDGAAADLLLVLARTRDGIGLFGVERGAAGLEVAGPRTSDLTRRIARVTFRDTPATPIGASDAGPSIAEAVLPRVAALLACEQVGGAARALQLAVDYACTRIQFGRPIGSFQAVKHRCADMLVAVESARSAAWKAVRSVDADSPDLLLVARIARAVCSDAYVRCASDCVQVHGGIGYTWEHPAHLHVKRSRGSAVLFGTAQENRSAIEPTADGDDGRPATGFRAEVRAWLETTPRPNGLRDYGPTPTAADVPAGREWQAALAAAGYACLHWPVRWGGRGAGVTEQAAFAEEAARAGVPRQLNIVGPDLVGPVLMAFGTPEQGEHYLPRIATGEDMWCQLFSETGAGSDLASVRTKAVRTGSGWRVDGQKVWTSGGDGAEFGLLLARSGGPGHSGLSVFVVPMMAAGVTVRPLDQMDGESKFNEVFLDGVELTPDALVGEEGHGWRVATATLGRERLSLGANAVGMFRALDDLVAAARDRDRYDAHLRAQVVELFIRTWTLRATWERAIAEGAEPGAASFSVLKLLTSETHRAIGDLGVEALGLDAVWSEDDEPLVHRMLVGHAQTILGGTSEIQRNILAERLLGMPREPSRPT